MPVRSKAMTYRGHEITIEQLEPTLFVYDVNGCVGGEHTSEELAIRSAQIMIDNMVGVEVTSSYTCNGSPKGCEGERFGGCHFHDSK